MDNSKWNYVLKASGMDLSQPITFGNPRNVEIEELQYFKHLNEAFLALLKMDPVQMDKYVTGTSGISGIYYDKVSIIDCQTQELLLEVGRVSILEAMEKHVQAGIFASLVIERRAFEMELDFDLSRLDYYLPGTDIIPLARYRFDQSLEVISSHARNNLTVMFSSGEQTKDQYQYYLLNVIHQFDNPSSTQNSGVTFHQYHYLNWENAFLDLLETDPNTLDRSIAGGNRFTSFSGIYNRHVQLQTELCCIRDPNPDVLVDGPGAYLQFHYLPKDFEKNAGTPLINLLESKIKNGLLPLFGYDDIECTSLSPQVTWNELRKRAYEVIPLEGTVSAFPFVLKVDQLPLNGMAPFISPANAAGLYTPQRFATLEDAINGMLALDERLFLKESADALGSDFYIRQAHIINLLENREVLAKFMISSNDALLPEGRYLKINDHKDSDQATRVMQYLLCHLQRSEQSANFLYKITNDPSVSLNEDRTNNVTKDRKRYREPNL